MNRKTIFAYGVISYAIFFCTYLYAYGFLGNVVVPKSLDAAPTKPFGIALAIDLLLLSVFAVQHSVMARPAFKRWWTQYVPQPAERSTYVLFSSVAMIAMFALWQPLGGSIWNVQHPAGRAALFALFTGGFLLVLVSTFLINHFDLFGLRQVWLHLRGKEYTPVEFRMPGPYKLVRHPLYVGWLLAFWATPNMTATRLMFALVTTAYILVAIQLEERDLAREHSEYDTYRGAVPMLIPFTKRKAAAVRAGAEA